MRGNFLELLLTWDVLGETAATLVVHLQALKHDTINTSLSLFTDSLAMQVLTLVSVLAVMLQSAGGLATGRLIRLDVHLLRCLIGSINSIRISHAHLRHVEAVGS